MTISASRRGRRAAQGDRRGPGRQERDERWDQSSRDGAPTDSYQDQRGRDSQSQRGSYSNFSRHAYSQPEPAPQKPQNYYPETGQRNEPPRYTEPVLPGYTPPPAPFEHQEPPQMNYSDAGRDDLFAREPLPSAYDQSPFGSQAAGYQPDPYDQNRGLPVQKPAVPRREEPQFTQRDLPAPPLDEYDDGFAGRGAQDMQASRFYFPKMNRKGSAAASRTGDMRLRRLPRPLRNTRRINIPRRMITTPVTRTTGLASRIFMTTGATRVFRQRRATNSMKISSPTRTNSITIRCPNQRAAARN